MPFRFEFIDQGRGLRFIAGGRLTGNDILEVKRALLREPEALRAVGHVVVVLTETNEIALTPDELRDIAHIDERMARLMPPAAVAVVAPSDHAYGMARMWEAYVIGTGWKTAVFRSPAEADAWLRSAMAAPA